jgi:hypothetical protein
MRSGTALLTLAVGLLAACSDEVPDTLGGLS